MNAATNKKWDGRWDQLKGRVKKLWGQITDDEAKNYWAAHRTEYKTPEKRSFDLLIGDEQKIAVDTTIRFQDGKTARIQANLAVRELGAA